MQRIMDEVSKSFSLVFINLYNTVLGKVIGSRGGDGEQESVTPLKEAATIRFRYLSAWKRGPWLTEPLKCQEKLEIHR